MQYYTTDDNESTDTEQTRVPVAGGTLVYEPRDVGRELVGAVGVTDWGDLADALAARGHARGDVYHLDELDGEGAA